MMLGAYFAYAFHPIIGALASCRHPKPGQFLSKKQGIPSVVNNSPASNGMGIDSK